MGMRAAVATLAALAAVAFAGAPPAAAAPADGLRIARDGERFVVAGPPHAGIGVWIDGDRDPGWIRVGANLPGRIESAPADCLPTAATEVTCPTWRSSVVAVHLGDGHDSLSLGKVPLRTDVSAGGGDDQVSAASAMHHDRFDGGPGHDSVNWHGREPGVGVSVRPMGVAGGEDQVAGIEQLGGTAAADDIVPGRDADNVFAAEGNDRVDLRDGRRNATDCGREAGDSALADPEDVVKCTKVERPPVSAPGPGAAVPAPPSPLRAAYADLVATPRYAGGAMELVLSVPAGDEATVNLSSGSWGQLPSWPLDAATAPADANGLARVALTLPAPAREALAADGRLRVTGELRLGGAQPKAVTFTLFTWRRSRVSPNVKRRHGSFGPQRLFGNDAADLITGASGDDQIDGRGGDDHLLGGTGNDRVDGSDGADLIDGGDGDDELFGGPGSDDLVEHRFGDDALSGGDGDDVLHGARGGDEIAGGAGDDVLSGGSGSDRLNCGPGHDIAFVNFAGEEAQARECEELYDEPGVVHLPCTGPGTAGPETLLGTEGPDACRGLGGDDDLEGRGGDDVLDAGDGSDRLFGRFGADRLHGGAGADELEGGRGVDFLDGGEGDDQLNGGLEVDTLFAGPGADRVTARGGGRDHVDCGLGADVAYVDSGDDVTGCERVHRSGRPAATHRSRRRG